MITTIEIPLPPEVAEIYMRASEADRERLLRWFQVMIEDLGVEETRSFHELMDEAGREAEANGLTPEILDSILNDEDDA